MSSQTTIIYFGNRGARLGNQLLCFANFIALCAEYPGRLGLVMTPFWKYADLAAGTDADPRCIFPPSEDHWRQVPVAMRAWYRLIRFAGGNIKRQKALEVAMITALRRMPSDALFMPNDGQFTPFKHVPEAELDSPAFWSAFPDRRRVFMSQFASRNWSLVRKHEETVRRFLTPPQRVAVVAQQHVEPLRRRHRPLIGFVMRQGDYRNIGNREWYLTSQQYVVLMEQLVERFGKDCALLVACDDPQDKSLFAHLPVYWCTGYAAGSGHYIESLAELSLCDLIVSVPSSFPAWAAFLGKIPTMLIPNANVDLRTAEIVEDHLFGTLAHPVWIGALL